MAASCSVGTINLKTSPFHCGTGRATGISPLNSFRPWTGKKPIEPQSLRIPHKKPWKVSSASSTTSLETLKHYDEVPKESGLTSELIPNFDEVKSLLTTICDTTSIVEVDLKVSGFELHVTRSFDAKLSASQAPPSAVPISSQTVIESPDLNGSVSAPTLAIIAKPEISSRNIQTLVDNAADEGLVIIRSPKVGFFRRSRTIKGKRAPPPCKEKQTVKEGQVVCYVEQLGGELPIESDVSGEVIKILREDGEPVGYHDHLIAILPSFPGIKKLQ